MWENIFSKPKENESIVDKLIREIDENKYFDTISYVTGYNRKTKELKDLF